MKIHWLQHVPFEGLGCIERWIRTRPHILSRTRMYANDSLPAIADFDMLIIMGGPMGVSNIKRYPWLAKEMAFIEKAIQARKPVLGICLGAQLIASALGARVYKDRYKEIGWFDVHLTEGAWNYRTLDFLPAKFTVFQWHGDTFDMPRGAQQLAYSNACSNQAFIYN